MIEDGLTSYNREKAGYSDTRPLAVLIREPGTGEIAGGLLGRTIYGLLFIDLIYLPALARGQGRGSQIMAAAEQEARRRGCTAAVLYTPS